MKFGVEGFRAWGLWLLAWVGVCIVRVSHACEGYSNIILAPSSLGRDGTRDRGLGSRGLPRPVHSSCLHSTIDISTCSKHSSRIDSTHFLYSPALLTEGPKSHTEFQTNVPTRPEASLSISFRAHKSFTLEISWDGFTPAQNLSVASAASTARRSSSQREAWQFSFPVNF